MVTCGKQSINHVAGNKSGRACDENPQSNLRPEQE
jgi:hypothetical protein